LYLGWPDLWFFSNPCELKTIINTEGGKSHEED